MNREPRCTFTRVFNAHPVHPCERIPTVAQISTILGSEYSVCIDCYKHLLAIGAIAKVIDTLPEVLAIAIQSEQQRSTR